YAMSLNEHRQTVTIHRLDQVVGCTEIKSHCLVIDHRDHNDRNLCELGIGLQLAQDAPAIALRHNHIQSDDQGTHFAGPAQTLFSSRSGDNTESAFGEKTRHEVADSRIIINHENRIELRLMLG